MTLFADGDLVACLVQFGVVGFFLFLSFISWVIKQVGTQSAAKERAAPANPRRPVVPARPNPYEAEVLEADVVAQPAGVVGQPPEPRLASTLSTEDLAAHAAQLGQLDDRPPEESIHDRFDDELGRLGDSSDAIHEDPNADKLPDEAVTTSEIVDVFRHPERIREAIILNEILTPVGQRWE